MSSDPPNAPDELEWMICRDCGWPLERSRRGGEVSWLHVRQDPEYLNHEPDPVPASQATTIRQRCDFCDATPVADIVLCRRFDMGGGQFSAGHWAACAACGTLIRNSRWGQLVTRVKQNSDRSSSTRGVPRKYLVDLFGKVEHYNFGVITFQEWVSRAGYHVPARDMDSN